MDAKINKDAEKLENHIKTMLSNTTFDRRNILREDAEKLKESEKILPEHLEALREFDKDNVLKSLTLSSRRNYLIVLRLFFLKVRKPLKKITRKDVEGYLLSIDKLSEPTKIGRKTTIKIFFQKYYKMKKGYPDVVEWISLRRGNNNHLPADQLLTKEEILTIANRTDNLRDKAIILLLYESACRIGEITNLSIKDAVSDNFGYVLSVSGKTGQRKIRIIDSALILKEWINNHPYKDNPDSPMFICLSKKDYGNRLTIAGIYRMIRLSVKRTEIRKRVHPHLFRHSRLTELAREGYQESWLKKFAGWTGSSRMPEIYISLSAKDIDDVMLEKKGLKQKTTSIDRALDYIICAKCNTPNSPTNKFCGNCAMPLDEESREIISMQEAVRIMMKEYPDLCKAFSNKLKEIKSK